MATIFDHPGLGTLIKQMSSIRRWNVISIADANPVIATQRFIEMAQPRPPQRLYIGAIHAYTESGAGSDALLRVHLCDLRFSGLTVTPLPACIVASWVHSVPPSGVDVLARIAENYLAEGGLPFDIGLKPFMTLHTLGGAPVRLGCTIHYRIGD